MRRSNDLVFQSRIVISIILAYQQHALVRIRIRYLKLHFPANGSYEYYLIRISRPIGVNLSILRENV